MTNTLLADMRASLTTVSLPGKAPLKAISMAAVNRFAQKHGTSPQKVELLALENDIVPLRYARNLTTYSIAEQLRLLKASAAVVGLGGLGGTVIEILARAGVGTLSLIDGDHFEDHNLNRQLTSACDTISTPKSAAARQRIAAINPSVTVQAHQQFLNEENAVRLIGAAQVVADCLDNIKSRFILARAARKLGRPLVSAAIAGLCGHVTTIYPEDPGLSLIYGSEASAPRKGAETALGSLPQTVVMLAALQSSEVFKVLLNRSDLLRNQLFVADLERNSFEVLKLL